MATLLLTAADLPSSDEDDVDFAPAAEAGLAKTHSHNKGLKRGVEKVVSPSTRDQQAAKPATTDALKKARIANAWDKLKTTQHKAPSTNLRTDNAGLCRSIAQSKAPPLRQVRRLIRSAPVADAT